MVIAITGLFSTVMFHLSQQNFPAGMGGNQVLDAGKHVRLVFSWILHA
jgi:hypothetical protein